MKIIIKNKEYSIIETGKFGREGTIYSIKDYTELKLVKVYDDERQTTYSQRKVTAIINKFKSLNLGGVENFIANPELPIQDSKNKKFCGFLMKNFNNHSHLFNHRYDLNYSLYKNEMLDDEKAKKIVSTLFAFLKVLHKAGFVLGDINPDNILLDNTFMPAIVDFDSAQIGTFYSNTNRQDYIDPRVRIDGYGRAKHFIYTTDSDIYSLAIVCYEFIIGIHPYFFQTSTPTDIAFKKKNSLSLIDYYEQNTEKLKKLKLEIFENAVYHASIERLNEIQTNHNDLYEFFKIIFMNDDRRYFGDYVYNIGSINNIDPFESIFEEIIPQTKEDPVELGLFMNQFKINIF